MDYSLYALQLKSDLNTLADTIRTTDGTTDKMSVSQMTEHVNDITSIIDNDALVRYFEDSLRDEDITKLLAEVKVIGSYAFDRMQCNIVIPSNITSVEPHAFSAVYGNTATISSAAVLKDYAIGSCRYLTKIYYTAGDFPNSIWSSKAFNGCGPYTTEDPSSVYSLPTMSLYLNNSGASHSGQAAAAGANLWEWLRGHLNNIGAPWGATNLSVRFTDGWEVRYLNGAYTLVKDPNGTYYRG